MLRKYPAGSTCGSGAFGNATLGMVGGIDILEKPGVAGDFKDDCEDMDAISARLDEFLRDPEVVEDPLSLRENRPMLTIRE